MLKEESFGEGFLIMFAIKPADAGERLVWFNRRLRTLTLGWIPSYGEMIRDAL